VNAEGAKRRRFGRGSGGAAARGTGRGAGDSLIVRALGAVGNPAQYLIAQVLESLNAIATGEGRVPADETSGILASLGGIRLLETAPK
jgi:hypothetical protein